MPRPGQLVGQVLGGRYRLIGTLGEGGVGTVYEALQEDLGRKVAVKVLHLALASDPAWVRRMEREARATAALHHPNIVQITDFQLTPGGLPFLVMERLTGISFRELIEKEAPVPAGRVVNIALQTLDALGVAHRAGIVHRDIKPENLFLVSVATPASPDFVKVLDFGIAKAVEGMATTGALSLTHTGVVLGTAGYMPPEQARGEPLDARADIFAVGACMYEALAGRAASADAKTEAGAHAVPSLRSIRTPNADDASMLAKRRPDLDPALTGIVTRALAADPAARFASAQEMIDALRAIARSPSNPVLTPPPRTPSASELAPTDPMAQPIVITPAEPMRPVTPAARAFTPPPVHPTRRPTPAGNATSRLGWIVAGAVGLCLLVPACVALAVVARSRGASSRAIEPPEDPPPMPPVATNDPNDHDDDDDDRGGSPWAAPNPTASATSPTTARRPRMPSPPAPKPSSNRSSSDSPLQLESAHATFQKALQIDDPAAVGRLRSFVIGTVSPMTHACFRTVGYEFQKGQSVSVQVQFTVHSDGHIDSFLELPPHGAPQFDCVDKKLRATQAPGVCQSTAPPSCTIYVLLEGKYR